MSKSNGSAGDGVGKQRETQVKKGPLLRGMRLSGLRGVAPGLSKDMIDFLIVQRSSTACKDAPWESRWWM